MNTFEFEIFLYFKKMFFNKILNIEVPLDVQKSQFFIFKLNIYKYFFILNKFFNSNNHIFYY